jgi:site-specific DNA-methyltransferase (adenine-specific)
MEKVDRENYAYAFIHEKGKLKLKKVWEMKFDVIVGNPPYQMNDGGFGSSAVPLYHKFVQEAIDINPRYIAMIIPSRYFAGGKGLDDFRQNMLLCGKIKSIHDFQDARMVFPQINLNGGVHYFLWDREHSGTTTNTYYFKQGEISTQEIQLSKYDIHIRINEAHSILDRVLAGSTSFFESLVSPRKPFGIPSTFKGKKESVLKTDLKVYAKNSQTWWTEPSSVTMNREWIHKWKLFIPKATDGNEIYPLPVLTEPIIGEPGSVCSETYLMIGPFDNENQAKLCAVYMKTRFFRFLLNLRKPTHNNTADKFRFIPQLPFDREWTDTQLFEKFSFSSKEIQLVESLIKEF